MATITATVPRSCTWTSGHTSSRVTSAAWGSRQTQLALDFFLRLLTLAGDIPREPSHGLMATEWTLIAIVTVTPILMGIEPFGKVIKSSEPGFEPATVWER